MEEKNRSEHTLLMTMILNYVYDMIGILMPITVFIDAALLVFGNVVSFVILELVLYWMFPVLLLSLFGWNVFLIYRYGGTCGNLLLHLTLYQENNVATIKLKGQRELLEKAIPFLCLYLMFHVLGVLLYLFFCLIFIMVDHQHRSWVDLVLHTRFQEKYEPTIKERIVIQI